jgi:prolipoprotein diacylglyceryl transferase
MQLASPGAILWSYGWITIRYYGVMIAFGFICALFAASRLAKKNNLSVDHLINMALWSFIFGIVGARAYYVLLSWSSFVHRPVEMFATWNGGLSIHGGIIGGIIAAWIYLRKYKQSFLQYADVMGACIPLAQAIGRWGNFFNSEAYGLPVGNDFPIKLYIPPESRTLQFQGEAYFHPTFLYESVFNLVLFILLYFGIAPRFKKYPGLTFCIYLAGYSIGRIIIEPLRVDSFSKIFNYPVPLVVSAVFLVFSLCAAVACIQKKIVLLNFQDGHSGTAVVLVGSRLFILPV